MKRDIFSQFSKKKNTHPHVFESFTRILMKTLKEYHQSYHQYHPLQGMRNTSTEYMMYMMSDNVIENPSFIRPHANQKQAFSKNFWLWKLFWKTCVFGARKLRLSVLVGKRRVFSSGLAYRPHVSGANGHL